jgi:hypothetical protein
MQVVGLATDDPMDTEARIGLKKHVWKHVSREEVVAIETAVVEAALGVGAAGLHGPGRQEAVEGAEPAVSGARGRARCDNRQCEIRARVPAVIK